MEAMRASKRGPSTMKTWSNLDESVLKHVLQHLSLRSSIQFGAVCRWWRTVQRERVNRPTEFPWLMFPNTDMNLSEWEIYSLTDGIRFQIDVNNPEAGSEARPKICCASHHGWLVVIEYDAGITRFSLFNPLTRCRVRIPSFERVLLLHGDAINSYLSSSPTDPGCTLTIVTSLDLRICRVGDSWWIRYPNLSSVLSVAACEGSLYGLLPNNCLMTLDSRVHTATKMIRMDDAELHPLPPEMLEDSASLTPTLVESLGELLLVLVMFRRVWLGKPPPHLNEVGIRLFRADLTKMAWKRVESLGDRVLFVGLGCSTSLSAAEIGGQGNHVYYIKKSNMPPALQQTGHYWWCWLDFDMGRSGEVRYWKPPPLDDENEDISGRGWQAPLWVVPDERRTV